MSVAPRRDRWRAGGRRSRLDAEHPRTRQVRYTPVMTSRPDLHARFMAALKRVDQRHADEQLEWTRALARADARKAREKASIKVRTARRRPA